MPHRFERISVKSLLMLGIICFVVVIVGIVIA